jgi:hypothetical protein
MNSIRVDINHPELTICHVCKIAHEEKEGFYRVQVISEKGQQCVEQKGHAAKFVYDPNYIPTEEEKAKVASIMENMWTIDLRGK